MDLIEAEREARAMIHTHLEYTDWHFGWDRAKMRAGQCDYRVKRITLSRLLVVDMSDEQFTETVLHEIGHALAGGRAGHGPQWARAVRLIGGNPARVLHMDSPSTPPAWVGTCPNGHTMHKHRMSDKARRVSCGKCCPVWNADYKYTWTRAA